VKKGAPTETVNNAISQYACALDFGRAIPSAIESGKKHPKVSYQYMFKFAVMLNSEATVYRSSRPK